MKPAFLKSFRRGSVLVFSLLVLSIMLVTSLTILSTALLDRKASLSTGGSARSFQVADSGVEETLYRVYKESHPTLSALAGSIGASCSGSSINFPSAGGEVKVTFYEDEETPYTGGCSGTDWRAKVVKIKSEGAVGSNARAVEVAVAAACPAVLDSALLSKTNYAGYTVNSVAKYVLVSGNYAYVSSSPAPGSCNNPSSGYYIDPALFPDWVTECEKRKASRGIYTFDISDPGNIVETNFFPTGYAPDGTASPAKNSRVSNTPTKMVKQGNYLYVSSYWGNFSIFDVSNPATPVFLSRGDETDADLFRHLKSQNLLSTNNAVCNNTGWGETQSLAIDPSSNWLYIGAKGGLKIFDVSDKSNPQQRGPVLSRALCGQPSYKGLAIPTFTTSSDQSGGVFSDVAVDPVDSNYVYLIGRDNSALYIINVSDPDAPFIEDSYTTFGAGNYPTRMLVEGDNIYVLQKGTDPKLLTFEVNRTSWSLSTADSETLPADPSEISKRGNNLYVTLGSGQKVVTFDIATPGNPTYDVDTAPINDTAEHVVTIADGVGFMAAGTGGFQSVQLCQ